MDNLVNPPEWVAAHRRAVLTTIVLSLTILVAVRLFVLPEQALVDEFAYAPFFRNLIDSLLATVFVSICIAGLLGWLGSPLSRTPAGGEIFPDTIGRTLEATAAVSDEWEYVGHTGLYVRSKILPILEARSKSQSVPIAIRFIIMNPFNDPLCERYAQYRTRSRSSTISPQTWTGLSVQSDLIATIIRLIQAKATYPSLTIHLGLSPSFSVWRYDKSESEVVMTQEDPQQPAYRYLRGSRFFSYCRQEGELAWDQADQHQISVRGSGAELSDSEVLGVLLKMFGRDMKKVEEATALALDLARSRKTPYA
jgi:hypothetical protein